MLFAAIKKSGKTTMAAMSALIAKMLAGRFAEIYIVGNDLEQSTSRVFRQCCRIVEASPMLRREVVAMTASRIEFADRSLIVPMATGYADAAGPNPTFTIFDEPWGIMSESGYRLWDEMVPSPARLISGRLAVTYAGFLGESDLLEKLYQRGLQGEEYEPDFYRQPGMLMVWSHEPLAPWQTPEWLEQARQQLRPNQYARMIENRWVDTDGSFVEMAWWDACVDPECRAVIADQRMEMWAAVDASTKHDATAIVGCTYDREQRKVRLVKHRIFRPTPEAPLDFEATIVRTLLEWHQQFCLRAVTYDPWQMSAVAQRLTSAGLPMREFPQTVPNLTEASTALFDLIKGRNLVAYPDDEMRLAISQAVARETARGWRIAKEKAGHKIDVVVALAQAAYTAMCEGQRAAAGRYTVAPLIL
jgi:phage terminase large subunit-like protein